MTGAQRRCELWLSGAGGRIFYSLLALSGPYLLWWAITWNFFGFRF
jgi:hypothetical protein